MRARFHRFLLMLLMLALPMQAFAYTAMQASMFSAQGTAEPMAMPAGTMSMGGCHTPDHSQSLPAQHECKICAACALASALPIEFTGSTPIVPIAHSFVSQPAELFSGFIPDGPDRPPRPFLA